MNTNQKQSILHNWTQLIFNFYGTTPAEKTEEFFMNAACQATGLSDWGDESFREPLRILLESYKKDAKLNHIGWFMIHQKLTQILCSRLLIRDTLKRNPEILRKKIEKPLFIISQPRTGTTLLQRLLGQDPFNRSLLCWEGLFPAPPPDPETHDIDPRIAETKKILEIQHKIMPEFQIQHSMHATKPEECIFLLEKSLVFHGFHIVNNLPTYYEWLNKQDLTPTYRYHRQQLQILQWHFPNQRWILKAPIHLHAIEALTTVYPDAYIVQTHRDPCKVIPSSCSLLTSFHAPTTDDLNLLASFASVCLNNMEDRVKRIFKLWDSFDPARLFDIHYKKLTQDPIGTVRGIYKHFGFEFTNEFEQRMKKYMDENPKNKHGVHHYSLEQFGLNKKMINRKFAKYCERFNIPQEG